MSTSVEHHLTPFASNSPSCRHCDEAAARIIEAGDAERRRLERNLHDGAQQQFVAVALELRMLATRLAPGSEAKRQLNAARGELQAALQELRALAHGLHPAVLSDHGLAVALESVADRAAIPVTLTVELDERPDGPAEIAAYYVVAEALTNIAKYAHATRATVTARRSAGALFVDIRDDGIGGAYSRAGSGLSGLADRVEAVGGRLLIHSPIGGGASITAALPGSTDRRCGDAVHV